MAVPEMGLFKFLKLSVCVAVLVVGALNFTESAVHIHFDQTPLAWSRFSTAVFRYSVGRPDGSNACMNNSCSIYCELDGQRLIPCHYDTVVLRNLTANHEHNFLLNVTTLNGEKNSSAYSWFIDTIPPTANVSSEQNYTSAEKITIDITFSEACSGHGFKCVNSSNCDLIVDGPAHVQASSLRIVKPNTKYSLQLVLSLKSTYGRVVVRMADNFCKDRAGNNFTRSNASTTIIHFDRRPLLVDLWSSIPSYELAINGVPRTVFATNRMENLEVYLDFSIPVINSTEQILDALDVNSGSLIPIHERTRGNRRFVFNLNNIASETEIITVKLHAGLLIGRTGTPVSPVASLKFLYDCTNPGVGLSTNSQNVTKEPNFNVVVEFTKPVFGFEASMIEVKGGSLIRFKELSRALYSLAVLAVTNNVVSITIPGGKVNDISGNLNVASNRLEMIHYSTPAIATALHSFVTAGVLTTTLAAAVLSLSSTNLGAINTVNSASNTFVSSDPSMNLHGMIGHLQVFVLSDWLLADQPIEYSETTKGLRWLIPRQKLPWKKNDCSIWPNNIYLDQGSFVKRSNSWSDRYFSHERACNDILLNNNSSYVQQKLMFPTEIDPKLSLLHGSHNISKENMSFGQPLNANEYFTYFLRGEPLSASNVVKKLENYKGWQDMAMNLFWLSIGGCTLLLVHFVLLVFLRWRMGTAAQGILSVPRFELLLLILMLPCVSQSAAFVIRGGTIVGIITGALLLAIPAAFILSVCLFLAIVVFMGSLVHYKEIRHATAEETWYKKLWFFFIGRPTFGRWFYKDGLPSSFLSRFGILFEDQKGPPLFVFVDQNDSNTMPRYGIGRMRAVSSDDSHEEMKISLPMKFLGCARSSYIILDLVRRVCLGVIAGSYASHGSSQRLCALTITLVQFLFLFTLKPHIRRGVYIAEGISLLSEAGVFGLSVGMNKSDSIREKTLGLIMLTFLFLSFVAQLVNEWYALIKCILSLSQALPHKNSFKRGLKFAAKGLLLPFLPRKHWSRVIPGSSQAKSFLAPVVPQSRETEFVRRDQGEPRAGQFSSMTATVVPLLSPDSPIIQATGTTAEAALIGPNPGESMRGKALKLEPKNDLKKLRELAKASFSGHSKDEETNTSYRYRLQSFSPENVSNDPSTSKVMK